jgi:predicted Zn-dependent peptidase
VPHRPAVTETQLPNGALIRLEASPQAASAGVVLRLHGGTREEMDHEAGHLHLLEHLLLRRTARRSAQALAECIASLGGEVNAETGREHLALVGRAPAERVPELAALLVECLCEPAFDETDLAQEQGAIAAERTFMGQMPPEEALLRLAWPAHPLGRPLLPVDTPHADVASLRALWSRQCVGARLSDALAPLAALSAGRPPAPQAPPRFVPGRYGEPAESRPATLLWAVPCLPFDAARTAGWELLGLLLEQTLGDALRGAGLAYACAVQPLLFSDAGVIVVQVQAPAGQVQRCRETAERCLDALAARGPDPARVQTARRARLARAVLAGDDAERRARALAASRSGRREDQADAVPGPCVPAAATLHLVV